MRKKTWALGMIVPLAATGVITSAPAASADPRHRTETQSDTCNGGRDRISLSGRVTGDHDDINLTVRLRTTHDRSHHRWTVTIRRPGRAAFFRDDVQGHRDFDDVGSRHRGNQVFDANDTEVNRRGADRFVARAFNHRTRQDCDVSIVVRGHNN